MKNDRNKYLMGSWANKAYSWLSKTVSQFRKQSISFKGVPDNQLVNEYQFSKVQAKALRQYDGKNSITDEKNVGTARIKAELLESLTTGGNHFTVKQIKAIQSKATVGGKEITLEQLKDIKEQGLSCQAVYIAVNNMPGQFESVGSLKEDVKAFVSLRQTIRVDDGNGSLLTHDKAWSREQIKELLDMDIQVTEDDQTRPLTVLDLEVVRAGLVHQGKRSTDVVRTTLKGSESKEDLNNDFTEGLDVGKKSSNYCKTRASAMNDKQIVDKWRDGNASERARAGLAEARPDASPEGVAEASLGNGRSSVL